MVLEFDVRKILVSYNYLLLKFCTDLLSFKGVENFIAIAKDLLGLP